MVKKGPPCSVCISPNRHLVELALVHRIPARVIAKRFGVSMPAVYRHKDLHLSATTRAAILTAERPTDVDLEQLQRSESEGLLGSLVCQRARLQQLSELAFEGGNLHAATSVERAITNSLELTSKLLGMLVSHTEVRSTSILISSDYLQLRGVIVNALRPYPEAARAVGAALAELESEAAEVIIEGKKPLVLEASPC